MFTDGKRARRAGSKGCSLVVSLERVDEGMRGWLGTYLWEWREPRHLPRATSSLAWMEMDCDFPSNFTTILRTLRAAVSQKSSAPRQGYPAQPPGSRPLLVLEPHHGLPHLDPEPHYLSHSSTWFLSHLLNISPTM